MPVITIEGPRIADLAKKRKLARVLTEAASEAFALPKETIVIILHETNPECVASGGELLCDRAGSSEQSSLEANTGRP
ncbi:MAG TPA: tautomerase family protein [Thermoleophilia bacterium]